MSKDPIGINGGLNQYTFCGNNPVMFGDPEGNKLVKVPQSQTIWYSYKFTVFSYTDAVAITSKLPEFIINGYGLIEFCRNLGEYEELAYYYTYQFIDDKKERLVVSKRMNKKGEWEDYIVTEFLRITMVDNENPFQNGQVFIYVYFKKTVIYGSAPKDN